MQAMKVRRLSDSPRNARRYLDGRRVSRDDWDRAHFGRDTDSYASRMETRRDGSVVVREFHCIRVKE
jgi:hypothetical protein